MPKEIPEQDKVARRSKGTAVFVLLAAVILALIVIFVIGNLTGSGNG